MKTKRALELELDEAAGALEREKKARTDVEEKLASITRERNELQAAVEEHELEVDLSSKRLKSVSQMQRLDQQVRIHNEVL